MLELLRRVLMHGANMQKYFFKVAPDRKFLWIQPEVLTDGNRTLHANGFRGASRHINYLNEIIRAVAIVLAPATRGFGG